MSKMKESFDEKTQDFGAFSPCNPGQTISKNQDVFNENFQLFFFNYHFKPVNLIQALTSQKPETRNQYQGI